MKADVVIHLQAKRQQRLPVSSGAREAAWVRVSLPALSRNRQCWLLGLRLLASRAAGQCISVVSATWLLVLCYGGPSLLAHSFSPVVHRPREAIPLHVLTFG